MEFAVLILIAFIFFILIGSALGFRNAGLKKRVEELQTILFDLRSRLETLEGGSVGIEPETTTTVKQFPRMENLHTPPEGASLPPVRKENLHGEQQPKGKSSVREHRIAAFLRSLEDRFSYRWTGILGVFALVVGFSFLAVLTALRMGQAARFLMLVGISLLFFGGSIFMQKKRDRTDIAGWFQSAAGALFLFACLGASSIPWLRWVQSVPQGYALLFLGIAANLYFALRVQAQLFSSFHTLISLAALAAAPPSAASLAAAAAVTAFSSIPLLRRPWGLHQFLAQAGYFLFSVIWVTKGDLNSLFTLTGIDLPVFGALLAGLLPGMIAPYVRGYQTDRFAWAARTAAWLYIAAGTASLGGNYSWVSFVFLIIGAGAYLSGRFMASLPLGIRRLDSLAGLALAVAAVFGFRKFNLELYSATAIGGLVALLAVLDVRREKLLRTVFSAVAATAAIVLFVFSFADGGFLDIVYSGGTIQTMQRIVLLYLVGGGAIALLGIFFPASSAAGRMLSLTGGFILAAVYTMAAALSPLPGWVAAGGGMTFPLLAGAGIVILLHSDRFLSRILLLGILLEHGLNYLFLLPFGTLVTSDFKPELISLLLLVQGVLLLIPAYRRTIPALFAVLLIVLDACIFILSRAGEHNIWLAVVLWACFSLILYGGAGMSGLRKDFRHSFFLCGTGVAVISALFALAGAEPLLDQGLIWWQRLLQDSLVVLSLLIWGRKSGSSPRRWLLLTAALFAAVYIGLEAGLAWSGVISVSAAIVLLLAGSFGPGYMRCYREFSLLFFWCGLILLPAAGIENGSLAIAVFGPSWWTALGSILLALLYVGGVYGIPSRRHTEDAEGLISPHSSHVLLYPYFVGVGIFLFLSFTGPVLTSLLILESFALFTMSILLKENSFRLSSFVLMLFTLGRLVFFDMAKSDTLERAVVFILAGAVLLGMNWMYGRFVEKAG